MLPPIGRGWVSCTGSPREEPNDAHKELLAAHKEPVFSLFPWRLSYFWTRNASKSAGNHGDEVIWG